MRVWGSRHTGCLAGHLHGLGPSVVPGGTRVGGDVKVGSLAGVRTAARALTRVRATAGTLASVGAAAGTLQGGDTGARGCTGPHQTGHAGRGHCGNRRQPVRGSEIYTNEGTDTLAHQS
jgi:hypothetical protein